MPLKDYLTMKEFCAKVGFSRQSVMTWLKEKRIKSVVWKGKHLFHKKEVERFGLTSLLKERMNEK